MHKREAGNTRDRGREYTRERQGIHQREAGNAQDRGRECTR